MLDEVHFRPCYATIRTPSRCTSCRSSATSGSTSTSVRNTKGLLTAAASGRMRATCIARSCGARAGGAHHRPTALLARRPRRRRHQGLLEPGRPHALPERRRQASRRTARSGTPTDGASPTSSTGAPPCAAAATTCAWRTPPGTRTPRSCTHAPADPPAPGLGDLVARSPLQQPPEPGRGSSTQPVRAQWPFYGEFDGTADNTFDRLPPEVEGAFWVATPRLSKPGEPHAAVLQATNGCGRLRHGDERRRAPGRPVRREMDAPCTWRDNDLRLVGCRLFRHAGRCPGRRIQISARKAPTPSYWSRPDRK